MFFFVHGVVHNLALALAENSPPQVVQDAHAVVHTEGQKWATRAVEDFDRVQGAGHRC